MRNNGAWCACCDSTDIAMATAAKTSAAAAAAVHKIPQLLLLLLQPPLLLGQRPAVPRAARAH